MEGVGWDSFTTTWGSLSIIRLHCLTDVNARFPKLFVVPTAKAPGWVPLVIIELHSLMDNEGGSPLASIELLGLKIQRAWCLCYGLQLGIASCVLVSTADCKSLVISSCHM